MGEPYLRTIPGWALQEGNLTLKNGVYQMGFFRSQAMAEMPGRPVLVWDTRTGERISPPVWYNVRVEPEDLEMPFWGVAPEAGDMVVFFHMDLSGLVLEEEA